MTYDDLALLQDILGQEITGLEDIIYYADSPANANRWKDQLDNLNAIWQRLDDTLKEMRTNDVQNR